MNFRQQKKFGVSPRQKKRDRLCLPLNLSGQGIEYGPLHQPIVTREMSQVRYVDYADRTHLVQKYRNHTNVIKADIVDIDIVTEGERIIRFIEPDSIDYIVASHVAEHVPDLISWLDDNLAILKPGGRISLAFPDKRFCFDMKRNSSSVSGLVAAWLEKRTRPDFATICEAHFNAVHASAKDAWAKKTTPQNATYKIERSRIIPLLKHIQHQDIYHDVHCWVFTAQEFHRILRDETGIRPYISTPYSIVSFEPARRRSDEFFVCLEKG
jgi:predicted SAM-dependent methyltransferase